MDFKAYSCEEFVEVLSSKSPVPGGAGSVTTSVLVRHVVEAAMRKQTVQ